MRFYTTQHRCSLGNRSPRPLHVRPYPEPGGEPAVQRNLPAAPKPCLSILAPYRDDVVVARPESCTSRGSQVGGQLLAQRDVPERLGRP
jgi:hypothetical protein